VRYHQILSTLNLLSILHFLRILSPQIPSKPQYPQPPQYPQLPQNPQTPSNPQHPQPLQYPPLPQNPQEPSKPQNPQPPQYPQLPKNPQIPGPPQYPQPQIPSKPQVPQPPQYPQLPKNPQIPGPPQYPKPQTPSKPQYPQTPQYPQLPQNPQIPSNPQYPQLPKNPQLPPQNPQPLQNPQLPQNPQIPSMPQYPQYAQNPQTPSYYPQIQSSCDVPQNARIPCGVADISATDCEARDCCFDGQRCYFGKGVTVQCTKDGQFIVVVAKDVTLPHIDLESIGLLGHGQSCKAAHTNSIFAVYFFPVTACGTIVMEEPNAIIYQNRMMSLLEVKFGAYGAITWDSSYELLFQCKYIGTSVETLILEVDVLGPPLPIAALGPINVEIRLASGQCSTKGCNEAAYTSYYVDSDYPVTKVLRDPVYVEVELLDKTDPALVLTLGRCWATTGPIPHSFPQWDILINGCPNSDDRYISSLVPVDASSGLQYPTHYRRFVFKMLTFIDHSTTGPLHEKIYVHCSAAVCASGPGVSCEPACHRKGSRLFLHAGIPFAATTAWLLLIWAIDLG
uniref:Zona pellucida sperm-binding protein 4 n=1 Tax=Nothobranchius furzeri TaxID=105023 RepID=A0A8C6PS85_NOTFU